MDLHSKQHSEAERKDHSEDLKALNAASLVEACPITVRYQNLTLFRGSLIDVGADCVVNAANERLQGGGGVDGLLHGRACSKDGLTHESEICPLCSECKARFSANALGARIFTGEAVVTASYSIPPSRFIVHTVAPYLDVNDRR